MTIKLKSRIRQHCLMQQNIKHSEMKNSLFDVFRFHCNDLKTLRPMLKHQRGKTQ